MRDIVIDVFLSVRNKMNPNKRKDVFELFGFDFLLDEDFRIWLIECNTNPYLGAPCKHMQTMVPEMMNDMFKLVVDPVYGPKVVPEEDRANGFELLYRESEPQVNLRRAYDFNLVYPLPELKPVIGKIKNLVKEKTTKPKREKQEERKRQKMLVKEQDAGTDSELNCKSQSDLKQLIEQATREPRTISTKRNSKVRSYSQAPQNPKLLLKSAKNDFI